VGATGVEMFFMTTGASGCVAGIGAGVTPLLALCPSATVRALVMTRAKSRAVRLFVKNLKDKLVNLT
jgi:hypothetical protein